MYINILAVYKNFVNFTKLKYMYITFSFISTGLVTYMYLWSYVIFSCTCICIHKIWCNIKTSHAVGSFLPIKIDLFFILQFQASWCLWPPAQLLFFKFLPVEKNFRYMAGVTFCWNFFLSYYSHKVSILLTWSLKYFETLLVMIE